MPDLPIPLPVVIVVGVLGGVLLTVLMARRMEWGWATVTDEPRVSDALHPGSDWEGRLLHLSDQEKLADEFPELRQAFADEVMSCLAPWRGGTAWRYAVWALLRRHLSPDSPGFWPDLDLNSQGPITVRLDLSGCRVRHAYFAATRFLDDVRFAGTVFTGDVTFEGACFTRHALFKDARFEGEAVFEWAVFAGNASFRGGTVAGRATFHSARFSAHTNFIGARFDGPFTAIGAGFAGPTWFRDVRFGERAWFADALFTGHADFSGVSCVDGFGPGRAWARTNGAVVRAWPDGWTLDTADRVLLRRPGRWSEVTPR